MAKNRERVRRYQTAYYQKNKERLKQRASAYAKAHPEQMRAWNKASFRKHKPKRNARIRQYSKKRRDALRQQVLEAYGHVCACCGECRAEFLALDHTNGDGAAHRLEIGGKAAGGARTYLWLKRHGFPKDRFRLLCHNCNQARGFYGYCPHEREREASEHQSSE